MAIENITEKVRKLLALAAEGSGATEAEAQSAAIQAQRIINKYQLDLAELVQAATDNNEMPSVNMEPITDEALPFTGKRIPKWEALLAYYLAPAFSCQSYIAPGRSIHVVGRETNRSAFKYTFNYLVDAIRKMAGNSRPANVHHREWNNSFGIGAAVGIRNRVQGELQQIKAANPSMALAIKNESDAVNDFVEANLNLRTCSTLRTSNWSARSAGMDASKTLNLGSVPGRTQNSARRLCA